MNGLEQTPRYVTREIEPKSKIQNSNVMFKTPEYLLVVIDTFIYSLKILFNFVPEHLKESHKLLKNQKLTQRVLSTLATGLISTFGRGASVENIDKVKPRFIRRQKDKVVDQIKLVNSLIDDNVLHMFVTLVLTKRNSTLLQSKFLDFFSMLISLKNIDILTSLMYRINLYGTINMILDQYIAPKNSLYKAGKRRKETSSIATPKSTLYHRGSSFASMNIISVEDQARKKFEQSHPEILGFIKNLILIMKDMRDKSSEAKVKAFFERDKRFSQIIDKMDL